jgi:hypothetical protein
MLLFFLAMPIDRLRSFHAAHFVIEIDSKRVVIAIKFGSENLLPIYDVNGAELERELIVEEEAEEADMTMAMAMETICKI